MFLKGFSSYPSGEVNDHYPKAPGLRYTKHACSRNHDFYGSAWRISPMGANTEATFRMAGHQAVAGDDWILYHPEPVVLSNVP